MQTEFNSNINFIFNQKQRNLYTKLKNLIQQFQLSLDYKNWKKNQWLQKGSSYVLLKRVYSILDNIESKHNHYEFYFIGDSYLFKIQQIQQIMYLLKTLLNHHEMIFKSKNSEIKTTQSVNLGINIEKSRFNKFTQQLTNLLVQKGCCFKTHEEIIQFTKNIWKKIATLKQFRKIRIDQLIYQLNVSIKYQKTKIQLIKQLYQIEKVKCENPFHGQKGQLLKQVIYKKKLHQIEESFIKFNKTLYQLQKFRRMHQNQ